MAVVTFAKTSSEDLCAVCLDPLNSSWTRPTVCHSREHSFHKDCLERCVVIKDNCPICRKVLNVASIKALFSWKETVGKSMKTFAIDAGVGATVAAGERILSVAARSLGLFNWQQEHWLIPIGNAAAGFWGFSRHEVSKEILSLSAACGMWGVVGLASGADVLFAGLAGLAAITAVTETERYRSGLLEVPVLAGGISALVTAGTIGLLSGGGLQGVIATIVNTSLAFAPAMGFSLAKRKFEWLSDKIHWAPLAFTVPGVSYVAGIGFVEKVKEVICTGLVSGTITGMVRLAIHSTRGWG